MIKYKKGNSFTFDEMRAYNVHTDSFNRLSIEETSFGITNPHIVINIRKLFRKIDRATLSEIDR